MDEFPRSNGVFADHKRFFKLQATVSAQKPRVEFVRVPTYRRGLFDGTAPENS